MIDLEKCQDGDFKICSELGKAYHYGNKATQPYEKSLRWWRNA